MAGQRRPGLRDAGRGLRQWDPAPGLYVEVEDNRFTGAFPGTYVTDTKTDERGRVYVPLRWPKSQQANTRTLRVGVYADKQKTILLDQTDYMLSYTGALQTQTISVTLPTETVYSQTTMTTLQSLHAEIDQTLVDFLAGKGIATLEDIFTQGGVMQFMDDAGAPANTPGAELIEHHALMSVGLDDPAVNAELLNAGYDVFSIGQDNSFRVVSNTGGLTSVGSDINAARLERRFTGLQRWLSDQAVALRSQVANGLVSDPVVRSFPGAEEGCDCDEHAAAYGPAAYLADLLEFVRTHVEVELSGVPADAATLKSTLHQPFADLRTKDSDPDKAVNVVQMVIEVLRRALDAQPGVTRDKLISNLDVRGYREAAYFALLDELGTSYAELRDVQNAGDEALQDLADRLQVPKVNLKANINDLDATLFVSLREDDGHESPTEEWMETIFGLPATESDRSGFAGQYFPTIPREIRSRRTSSGGERATSRPNGSPTTTPSSESGCWWTPTSC